MLLLAALTSIRLVVAGFAPLAPDEAYYWVWSRALAPGYLDHPPMVALWIWLGTAVAGDGALGVRLLAPLSAALGSLMLLQTGDALFPNRHAGQIAVVLLNATLLFGVGAVSMTPDTPLLFFWTACLWAIARLHRSQLGFWWLIAGLAAGLAMDSKYTACLLPVGLGLWCLFLPKARRWLLSPWPWLGAALAGASFLPVIFWNATHDWASFAKQGGRGFVWHPWQALRYLSELLGGQLGLATPLVFVLCVAGTLACARTTWRDNSPAEGLIVALSVPPVLLFLQHALGDRVQANWPAIFYPASSLGAAVLGDKWRSWFQPAARLGFAITALVYLLATFQPMIWPGHNDPLARLRGWAPFAKELAQLASAHGAAFIASDNYGTASLLARSDIKLPIIGAQPRWAFFNLPSADALQVATTQVPGLFVTSPGEKHDMCCNMEFVQQVIRPGSATTYDVYSLPQTPPGALLPRR